MPEYIDFALTEDNDMKTDDVQYLDENDKVTALINAFHTDGRDESRRGYWLEDIPQSTLWTFDQARLNSNTAGEMEETAREVAEELVDDGLFERIDISVAANIRDGCMDMTVRCYNEENILILNRVIKVQGS